MKCTVKNCTTEGDQSLFTKSNLNSKGDAKCKKCKAASDKRYAQKNKEKLAEYHAKRWRENKRARIVNRKSVSQMRFGLDADLFVKDKVCADCGMTNQQHLKKWGERLNINHINNAGRKNMRFGLKPDNSMGNLEPLCRACHCVATNKQRDYSKTRRSKQAA